MEIHRDFSEGFYRDVFFGIHFLDLSNAVCTILNPYHHGWDFNIFQPSPDARFIIGGNPH